MEELTSEAFEVDLLIKHFSFKKIKKQALVILLVVALKLNEMASIAHYLVIIKGSKLMEYSSIILLD